MAEVVHLDINPVPFLQNEEYWSGLNPNQKGKLVCDSASSEIDTTLKMFADHKLSLQQAKEIILDCANLIIQD